MTEALGTDCVPHLPRLSMTKDIVPESELRGSGNLTQRNTVQNPSVYSSAQKRCALTQSSSPLGTPATSTARYRALCIFHWTRFLIRVSTQGTRGFPSHRPSCRPCSGPVPDPSATLRGPGCGQPCSSPPAPLLRGGPCFSFTAGCGWVQSSPES